MRKPITVIVVAGALAVGVAACGGSACRPAPAASTTPSASSPPAGPHGSSSALSISAAQSGTLMFSTKALAARAGRVTITFTNRSPEDHNFTLARSGGSEVAATPTFDGGSRTLRLHLAAGSYIFFCSVPGHRQAGMEGTLTVT